MYIIFILDRQISSMHNVAKWIEIERNKGWFVQCMKVREVIKLIEADGWHQVSMKGDHRQYKHSVKHGRVTVAGHLSVEVPPKTLSSIFKQAQLQRRNEMYRFLVIIEKGNQSYGAYSPDLPGCIAVGKTQEEVEKNMREAIAMHIQGMIEDQEPIPVSDTVAEYMDISLPNTAA